MVNFPLRGNRDILYLYTARAFGFWSEIDRAESQVKFIGSGSS